MIDLKNAGAESVQQVGHKAYRLSQMLRAGIAVKPAIVITVDEVRMIIERGLIPSEMIDTLMALFNKRPVMVRSTAFGEDGELEWAGCFRSSDNPISINMAEREILRCAHAQDSEEVLSYATQHSTTVPPLALLVQEAVVAVCSGVLFTRHPNPHVGEEELMAAEVVDGMGCELVSGRRSPRCYFLTQAGEVVREEGALNPQLSQEQLTALCSRGSELRQLFGGEQDVEWAIDQAGAIFINQSRPARLLVAVDTNGLASSSTARLQRDLENEHARLRALGLPIEHDALSDNNIVELITAHPCSLAFGLFIHIFSHGEGAITLGRRRLGYDLGPEVTDGFQRLIAGQPRCSIVHDALTYRIAGISLEDYGRFVDYYLERIAVDPSLANYPEVVLYNQDPSEQFLLDLFGHQKAAHYRECYDAFFARLRSIEATLSEQVQQRMSVWQWQHDNVSATDDDFLDAVLKFRKVCDFLRTDACMTFVEVARLGFFAYARLRQLLEKVYGEEAERRLNTITAGIRPEQNPNLQFGLQLAALQRGETSLGKVLSNYGHLSPHELEISTPRYWEAPALLERLAAGAVNDIEEGIRESVRLAEAAQKDMLHRAGPLHNELERTMRAACTYLPLRESVKFNFVRGYDTLRRQAMAIERRLGWPEGTIFHLVPEEIFALPVRADSLREIALSRQQEQGALRSVYVPPVVFSNDLQAIGRLPEVGDGRILRGIGVTNVVSEGHVVVASTPEEAAAQLLPGDILVTETTDPAWTPMFGRVGQQGGLVTEVGGQLSHGAIYCRSMQIAAVLNVPFATRILRTGMRVRVNGPGGYVEIL